jgi:hypothetical protein
MLCVPRRRWPPDVTVHFVLNDFRGLGRAYVETDEDKADQATIVDNILSASIRLHCG